MSSEVPPSAWTKEDVQIRKKKVFIKRKNAGRSNFGPKSYSNNNSFGGNRSSRDNNSSRPSNFRRPSQPARRGGRFAERIDQSLFVKKAVSLKENPVKIDHAFADFSFCPEIKANLKHKLYVTPTPIQDQGMSHILAGKDLIGLANTGTGKTAAFLLPLIDKVFKNKNEKVLIVTPTRELALQIDNEFRQFAWNMKIFSAACVGGAPIYKQINNLKRNPNFIIGTPGRLKDLCDRRLIQLETFQNVVLDEVDRMLDMGFIDDIKYLLKQLPETRQSLFFSATMPPKIRDLVGQFTKEPVVIEVKTGNTAQNVDQDVVRIRDRTMKFHQLKELLRDDDLTKVLIFIETKAEVEKLTTNLVKDGFSADSIHGDKKQNQRQRALQSFRNNDVTILVATDVAARGLDIKDISHVINYTVPQTYDDYVHRIGRTGRGDKKGCALTFVEQN